MTDEYGIIGTNKSYFDRIELNFKSGDMTAKITCKSYQKDKIMKLMNYIDFELEENGEKD